ncbi:MAG TPA: hypothetical protein VNO79_00835 [Actinomycetota bacterium]|nr:hypothetical protein [Actinomycetota bacterium]
MSRILRSLAPILGAAWFALLLLAPWVAVGLLAACVAAGLPLMARWALDLDRRRER